MRFLFDLLPWNSIYSYEKYCTAKILRRTENLWFNTNISNRFFLLLLVSLDILAWKYDQHSAQCVRTILLRCRHNHIHLGTREREREKRVSKTTIAKKMDDEMLHTFFLLIIVTDECRSEYMWTSMGINWKDNGRWYLCDFILHKPFLFGKYKWEEQNTQQMYFDFYNFSNS